MFNIDPVSSGFPCKYNYVLQHAKLKIINIDIHRAFFFFENSKKNTKKQKPQGLRATVRWAYCLPDLVSLPWSHFGRTLNDKLDLKFTMFKTMPIFEPRPQEQETILEHTDNIEMLLKVS